MIDVIRNAKLQSLCRHYLTQLKSLATKYKLGNWLDDLVQQNANGQCSATKDEVIALSRLCDDERITRLEIPPMLNKSYRGCVDDGDFDKIQKLPRQGVYCKVDAMMYIEKERKTKK